MDSRKWESEMANLTAQALDGNARTIQVGDRQLDVEVAAKIDSRRRGLRGLSDLPRDGMLFVYQGDHSAPYSNAEMEFDVDIYFFDAEGEIVHTGWDGEIAQSPAPYRYVLETEAAQELVGRLEF